MNSTNISRGAKNRHHPDSNCHILSNCSLFKIGKRSKQKYFVEENPNKRLTLGPKKFILDCRLNNDNIVIITDNSYAIYEYFTWNTILEIKKHDYTEELYFQYSLVYDHLPSPDELKELRKYFNSNYKNKIIYLTKEFYDGI